MPNASALLHITGRTASKIEAALQVAVDKMLVVPRVVLVKLMMLFYMKEVLTRQVKHSPDARTSRGVA